MKQFKDFCEEYQYNNLQLNFDDEISAVIREYGMKIPDKLLAPAGREDEPHITLRYGIYDCELNKIRNLIEGFGPIIVTLGDVTVFKNVDCDVLKIDVQGGELYRMRALLNNNIKYTGDFPDFMPHVTIAFLQPGTGEQFCGPYFKEQCARLTFREVIFGAKNETKIHLKLV